MGPHHSINERLTDGGHGAAPCRTERRLVPSPKVATYDLQPEMSAAGVTDELVAAIGSGRYDFIVANFANPDMVGHTGVWDATVTALGVIDGCLGRIFDAVEASDAGDPDAPGGELPGRLERGDQGAVFGHIVRGHSDAFAHGREPGGRVGGRVEHDGADRSRTRVPARAAVAVDDELGP